MKELRIMIVKMIQELGRGIIAAKSKKNKKLENKKSNRAKIR